MGAGSMVAMGGLPLCASAMQETEQIQTTRHTGSQSSLTQAILSDFSLSRSNAKAP